MTIQLITRYVKLLVAFALFWAGMWVYNNYGCRRIDGHEMVPTLAAEKSTVIDPKTRHPDQLSRDDFISYHFEQMGKSQKNFAARVIGLPGDRVKLVKGEVFVNGERIESRYVDQKNKSTEDYAEIIVPRDTVFVLCDNRRAYQPYDSRSIGPIGAWAINGKIK